MSLSEFNMTTVDWSKSDDGLVPAVIQDATTLRVLMLGYMNADALSETLKSGYVTFYSRSKKRLWRKGETSGHVLKVKALSIDCDQDTFLVTVDPEGPTCHTGTTTCFGEQRNADISVIEDLAATIKERRRSPGAGSYTQKLFDEGLTRIAQKVGEEGVETALAGATKDPSLAGEAADLLYHLLVLLEASDVGLPEVLKILRTRENKKSS